MGFAENRGTYWRGRYKISTGKYGTVADDSGEVIRFRTKREAKHAADAEEAKVRAGSWRDPAAGQITFGAYASRWYAAQDLAASTMQNYRRHLEEHLLPEFEDCPLASIQRTDVETWEKREKALYAASSVKTWRGTLHLVLEDAVDEGLLSANPATKRRGRGKRAGRSRDRGPEKVITDPLGILLVAERASLLSGRDDEFVACVTKGYTGLRWGELVGLETQFLRPQTLRVEWQLYELDTGQFEHCPPKDDSYRTIDMPRWLCRPPVQARGQNEADSVPVSWEDVRISRTGAFTYGGDRRKGSGCGKACRCLHWHCVQRPQPARGRSCGDASARPGSHRCSRLHARRRCCRPGRPLAAERLCDVAVHAYRIRLVPEEGASGSAPCAASH